MRYILPFLFLLVSGAVLAETDAQGELNRLDAELDGVRQEQQAVYQNYQMTRDMRLMEVQEGRQPYDTSIDSPPPNYEDVMREQLESEQRIQQYTDELRGLAQRYLDLEDQRKILVEQIRELKRQAP